MNGDGPTTGNKPNAVSDSIIGKMEKTKPRVQSVTINNDGRLPLPTYYRPVVCTDYASDSPDTAATFWVVSRMGNLAALADEWVNTPRFKTVGNYNLQDGSRIQIPSDVTDNTALTDDPGSLAYYVWFPDEPGQDRPPLVFVLTEDQFWEAFPDSETAMTYSFLFSENE